MQFYMLSWEKETLDAKFKQQFSSRAKPFVFNVFGMNVPFQADGSSFDYMKL